MMHLGELNWEPFPFLVFFCFLVFSVYLARNASAMSTQSTMNHSKQAILKTPERRIGFSICLADIQPFSSSSAAQNLGFTGATPARRRGKRSLARSDTGPRRRPLGSPPNAMATLAAALLLFPLSARGKKRGKRKPDASTVAASMQYHQRGTMAHVHGDIDGAKQAFREAIKLKPDFSYAYYRLAFVMHEQAQQERLRQQKEEGPLRPTEDPVPVFREAIRLDGRDEMYYYSLGQALKDQLDLQGAVDTFSAVTRFNPRSAQAYWAIGKVRTSTQPVGTRRARAVACPLRRCMPRPATSSIRIRMIPMTPAISTRSP